MDLTQTLEDVEDVAETYEKIDTTKHDEDDTKDFKTELEDEEKKEEKKDEIESKDKIEILKKEEEDVAILPEVIDEIDILAKFIVQFEARKRKELEKKAEEKKKQLQQLIVQVKRKKEDEASEETPITPEGEEIAIDRVSTESSVHPCLREIDISDSQLKIVNPYTVYPIPDDPGLSPAFWLLGERPPIYSTDGVQKFYDTVKRADLRPISSLKDMLITDQLNLRYYGLESKVMRAICEALADNTFVQKVDLKDNRLSPEACGYLNNLLLRNNTIIDLSLSGCRIGASGAKKLYNAISENITLKTLDLSRCDIGNEGFAYIASALSENRDLESVNLSDNHLDESCYENLRDLLLRSKVLHLDLSWNSLYSAKTWKALVDGLKKNEALRSLNLSWNSLGEECVPHLYTLLLRSRNIEKLDLSWNRFTEKDAEIIAKALSKNNKLKELYLGNNSLKTQGAAALVRAITPQLSPNSALHLLDLENVWANKNILDNLETIKNFRPWVTIKLGGILSNYKIIGPNVRKILLDRANYEAMQPKQKRQQRNFGHFVMSLEDTKIKRTNFTELVKKFKLKLSTSLVDEIMNAFEGPKDIVDQELLKSFYLKEYPETVPEEAALKLKKKKMQITE